MAKYTKPDYSTTAGVTLQGDLTFSYQHQTKTLIYKGSNMFGKLWGDLCFHWVF